MTAGSRPIVLIATPPERANRAVLESEHYAVVHVHTGALAIEWARELRPDTVILEADLPDLPAIEVCRRLRADLRLGHKMPILLFAAETPSGEERVAGLRAGAWDFVRRPADADELSLTVRTYVQAKRNIDLAVAEEIPDPETGLLTRGALARRARELGAVMARTRGALACVVFALDGAPADPRLTRMVAHSARSSDVVGALGPGEFAVLAPGTDEEGAVKLAQRVGRTLSEVGATLKAGCHAVANLKYSPMDPVELLTRAAAAVRHGIPEPDCAWVRRAEAIASGRDSGPYARVTQPGIMLDHRSSGV